MDRPNLVVVVLDAVRADHLPPHQDHLTPSLAGAVSGEAVVPERVYAVATLCPSSHGALLSGAFPAESGIRAGFPEGTAARADTVAASVRAQESRWLPEALRRAGYHTWAVSANPWVSPAFGFDCGFDRFVVVGEARACLASGGRGPRRNRRRRRLRDVGGPAAVRQAGEFIQERPFFGLVNLMEAHRVGIPPRRCREYHLLGRFRALRACRRRRSFRRTLAYTVGREVFDERELGLLRGAYRGNIRYLDLLLRRFLRALPPDTIVVVTSDHGEALGERHALGHHLTVREEVLRVPFVVLGAPGPVEIGSLLDVPALMGTWAGIDTSAWNEQRRVPSQVVVAEYEPSWPGEERLRDYAASLKLSAAAEARLRAPMAAVIEGRRKLVVEGRNRRLVDPDDEATLLHEPEVARRLEGYLDALRAATPAVPPADGGSDSLEQSLARLGYL